MNTWQLSPLLGLRWFMRCLSCSSFQECLRSELSRVLGMSDNFFFSILFSSGIFSLEYFQTLSRLDLREELRVKHFEYPVLCLHFLHPRVNTSFIFPAFYEYLTLRIFRH